MGTPPKGGPNNHDWGLGLSNLNSRARAARNWLLANLQTPMTFPQFSPPASYFALHYSRLDIWHLQATSDTEVKPSSCGVIQEGLSRAARWTNFRASLEQVPPPAVVFSASFLDKFVGVPLPWDDRHDGLAIYTSPEGRTALDLA